MRSVRESWKPKRVSIFEHHGIADEHTGVVASIVLDSGLTMRVSRSSTFATTA